MALSLLTMARKAKSLLEILPSTPYEFYAKEMTASQRVTTIF